MPTYTKTALSTNTYSNVAVQPMDTISFRILTDALDQVIVNGVDTLIWQPVSYKKNELNTNTFTNVELAT